MARHLQTDDSKSLSSKGRSGDVHPALCDLARLLARRVVWLFWIKSRSVNYLINKVLSDSWFGDGGKCWVR